MTNTHVPIDEYLVTRALGLDLEQISASCARLHERVTTTITEDRRASPQETLDHAVFSRYNVFLFPSQAFHALFREIQRSLFAHRCCDPTASYYMQSWLNVYHSGETLDWHRHWPTEARSFHGFYCVDVKGSSTEYRFPDRNAAVEVVGEDDTLVLGPAEGDLHRTTPRQSERPRITIAFDLVPQKYLESLELPLNHWLPVTRPETA